VFDRAISFARDLAAGAPLAVQYTKQAVNQYVKQVAATSFDLATALEITTFRSADHAEALAAFREKRPPRFQGL
jgi:enoyl-CoA hydratase